MAIGTKTGSPFHSPGCQTLPAGPSFSTTSFTVSQKVILRFTFGSLSWPCFSLTLCLSSCCGGSGIRNDPPFSMTMSWEKRPLSSGVVSPRPPWRGSITVEDRVNQRAGRNDHTQYGWYTPYGYRHKCICVCQSKLCSFLFPLYFVVLAPFALKPHR